MYMGTLANGTLNCEVFGLQVSIHLNTSHPNTRKTHSMHCNTKYRNKKTDSTVIKLLKRENKDICLN